MENKTELLTEYKELAQIFLELKKRFCQICPVNSKKCPNSSITLDLAFQIDKETEVTHIMDFTLILIDHLQEEYMMLRRTEKADCAKGIMSYWLKENDNRIREILVKT